MKPAIAILGASYGLGEALSLRLASDERRLLLLARDLKKLSELAKQTENLGAQTNTLKIDLARPEAYEQLYSQLIEFNPSHIIYCAGGGPYGSYHEKKWSDHEWALQLNFLTPARLLHQVLAEKLKFSSLTDFVYVGSEVAENQPDVGAASYAAAKHGMRGLISTLKLESENPKIHLFSPGYMDTRLLPKNAWPRHREGLVAKSHDVANSLALKLVL